MPNTIITPQIIAKEALMQLENNVVMGKLVHREYKNEFVKVGDSVSVRKPVRFSVTDGATRVNQDVQEATTPFTIDKRKHVSWKFSTQELTMKIEEYSERYIAPAMIQLADAVDNDLTALYNRVAMYTGTAGTTPNTFKAFGGAMTRLDEAAVPMD
ncbi:MAG: P22 phage major capsid protein family protein, partial [Shewanella sp.]